MITSFGDLNLTAQQTLTLGDQIAVGNINLSANQITLMTHPVGRILTSNGSVISSLLLHSTAGGLVTTSYGSIVFEGSETPSIIENSFQLTVDGQAAFRSLLDFEGVALNFNTLSLEDSTLTTAPLLPHPYTFAPTYQKMPYISNKEGYSLDVLALVIEENIKAVHPSALLAWRKIKQQIMTKNPIDKVLSLYLRKLNIGIFSPSRFINGLTGYTLGKQALAYLQLLGGLEDKLMEDETKEGIETVGLLQEFTRPKKLSPQNWKLVQMVIQNDAKAPAAS